ncbi:two-component regulator propeller domain-containing protein [Reichenbachiella agariperforans]|uniref:two-component regulator propeller domain-containing protein n=1 Tax=Reichenbachiella agariperforans TaxID=156994 RepID=UPI001C07FE66|nr:two-component regulator propeller domain-containing protein [Reichenbachiella agariperforans]MBU2912382.1 response regulator [Reichenbachiella agariperforans]
MMKKRILVWALQLWAVGLSWASHEPNIRFQHLTTANGLAQNMVDCMLQDSQGYIWLGTWNGLCKYDGYSFETFDSQANVESTLGNNFVYALLEDHFGNIWVGTSKGLYVYLYDSKTFRYTDLSSYDLPKVAAVHSLHTMDSILYIGSTEGLTSLEIKDNQGEVKLLQHLQLDGRGELRGTVVNAIAHDTKEALWVGTDSALYRLGQGLQLDQTYQYDPMDGASITANLILDILLTRDGQLWIATEIGVNRYDPVTDGFVRYYSQADDSNSLLHNSVLDLAESGNQLYIATLGGLSVLNVKTDEFSNYRNNPSDNFSLNNDFLNCLLVDTEDNVWIGTERGGVNIINARQNSFEQIKFEIGNPNSLSHSTVNSIYEGDKHVWIGTAGGGLNRMNKKTKSFKHFKISSTDHGAISSDFVTKIYRMKNGELWVGTWGQGINILPKGQMEAPFLRMNEVYGMGSNAFISSIIEDNWGYVWIGTLGGLYRLDRAKREMIQIQSVNQKVAISGVGCLALDSRGKVWVGTREGLFQLDPLRPNESIQIFQHESQNTNSISGNYVISLIEDYQGNMWVGTYGQGINKITLEGRSEIIKRYDTRSGLSNNIIFGIEEAGDHSLWLSTDYGLSRFDPETETSRNFYVSDGLLNNQYYWSSSYKNEEGKFYFGGMNGVDAMHPDWISDEIDQPHVVITDLKLLDESVVSNHSYNGVVVSEGLLSNAKSIELSYKEKIVSFEFSTFNFLDSDVITFAYYLDGFDQQWNHIGSKRHFASYTNLKPGEYIFKVKAAGPNGIYNDIPTELKIRIRPPYWQTTWFQLLLVAIIASVILGYIRYRVYSLKRQRAVLEQQVRERTEEINRQKEALTYQSIQLKKTNESLEDKQKYIEGQNQELESKNKEIGDRRDELLELNNKLKLVSQLRLSFFTNISHEFRTPLTLIIGPLERLMSHYSFGEDVKNHLDVINRNAKRLLHLINEIMDFRKIEQGKAELKVSRGDIKGFCIQIFEAFEPLAEIKSIDFSYEVGEMPSEVCFDVQKIENMLYNLLSNAFKYTPNGGKVKMVISNPSLEESKLMLDEEHNAADQEIISVKITDSGSGISEENLPLIFKRFYRIESENAFKIGGSGIGLAITEELIKAHHGEIFVSSQLGEGSVFEIQFPCLRTLAHDADQVDGGAPNIQSQIEILKNELVIREDEPLVSENLVIDEQRRTVLVVEDNLDLRKFISLRLSEKYNIVEAGNGLTGMEFAEQYNPDLIVSDVMMPKMDGFELCTSIKNNFSTSHIPVVLLTAKSSVENQIEGLQIGADDYLPKPFNFELLEARISNLIESRRKLREQFATEEDVRPAALTQNTKDQKFLEQAITVVEEQMSNSDFSSKDLVTSLGISRSLLHKKLSALTNQSASEFINHFRMKKSKELLKTQELNVSEVAYAVGYNDPKYFSRLFSKYYGHSPKQYQEGGVDFR